MKSYLLSQLLILKYYNAMNMVPKKFGRLFCILGLLCLINPLLRGADEIVFEDWSAYAPGSVPVSPWVVETTGGSATVQSNDGSNRLYIDDPTDAGTQSFYQEFAPTTSKLEVSFKFNFASLGAATGYRFKVCGSSASPGAYFNSAIDFSLNSMSYNDAAGGWSYLPGFSMEKRPTPGVTYTMTFKNISLASETYDIKWMASDGTSGSLSGVGFASGNCLPDFASVYFGSGKGAIGSYYLDDVVVKAPIVSEDWSAYAIGDTLEAPWVVNTSEGSVAVQSCNGSNRLYIDDPTCDGTQSFYQAFAPTTKNLEVSFKFNFASLGASTGYRFKVCSSGANPGNYLYSAIDFSLNSMSYVDAEGEWSYLPGFSMAKRPTVGATYTMVFRNISLDSETYDINWMADDGTSGSLSGVGFASGNYLLDFASVYFGTGSGAIAAYYLDDVVVKEASLVSEDWSAYMIGNAPVSPWVVKTTGGSATVQSRNGSNQLYINDTTAAGTQTLYQTFSPTTKNLEVSFKFNFTSLGAANSYRFKLCSSSANPGHDLYKAIDFSLNSMSYRDAQGNWSYLPGFSTAKRPMAGVTYTMTFKNISLDLETYDINWTASNGTSGSLGGVGFVSGNCLVNFDSIYFGPGSGAIGAYYLDDVAVNTLPTESLSVDFPSSPTFPVFAANSKVNMLFNVTRTTAAPSVINWMVVDYARNVLRSGTITAQGLELSTTHPVEMSGLPSGYMEVQAEIANGVAILPALGTRPLGMASFGILPTFSALTLAHPSDSRFGLTGSNFLLPSAPADWVNPVYTTLGTHWAYNSSYQWANREPNIPGEATAATMAANRGATDYIVRNGLYPMFDLYKRPTWSYDVPVGFDPKTYGYPGFEDQAFALRDPVQYQNYAEVLSAEMAYRQNARFGVDLPVYYKLDWEPEWHWKGTVEEAAMQYGRVSLGIHEADPNAKVLMPTYAMPENAVLELTELLPALQNTGLGLDGIPDGVSFHGYYRKNGNPDDDPNQYVPEYGNLEASLAAIKSLMATYLKTGAEMHQTEWGMDYRAPYMSVTSDMILKHAAYTVRGHLIFLGEGCRTSWFFYNTDGGNPAGTGINAGAGLLFNLTMGSGYGVTNVSPKPAFMAGCALTRLIDGTTTTGRLIFPMSSAIYGYAFKRADENVVAIWCKDNVDRSVTIATGAASVTLCDFMGNPTTQATSGGDLTITAGQCPRYIIGMTDSAITALLRP
ncbi:MAG: hypothetical protein WAX69_23130 [Victivallales bacterium]